MKRLKLFLLCAILGLNYSQIALAQNVRYTRIDLGTLPGMTQSIARDLNKDRIIVGNSSNPGQAGQGFVSNGYQMADITSRQLFSSWLYAINNNGVIVGSGSFNQSGPYHAILYTAGRWIDLDPEPASQSTYSYARDINNQGQVVGYFGQSTTQAALWQNGSRQILSNPASFTSSRALAISDSGLVVGHASSYTSSQKAICWENGVPTVLTGFTPSSNTAAFDVTTDGTIYGKDSIDYVKWTKNGLSWTVQSLSAMVPGAYLTSYSKVNDQGEMVGYVIYPEDFGTPEEYYSYHAIVFRNRVPQDLHNSLVVPLPAGEVLMQAMAINNNGSILAFSKTSNNSPSKAYLLEPFIQGSITLGRR